MLRDVGFESVFMSVPLCGNLFEPRPSLFNSPVDLPSDLGQQVLPAGGGLLNLFHQAVEFALRKLFDLGLDGLKAFVDLGDFPDRADQLGRRIVAADLLGG